MSLPTSRPKYTVTLSSTVRAICITDKLEVSQPAASRHMKVLVDAGLVVPTARSGWVYYRRNEPAVDALKHQLLAL